MTYTFFDFLQLVGSLGLFIYGMKVMSDGLQKIAGGRLRKIIKGMTSSRPMGIVTGFLTTAIIQSSSATTVMVVSFVNAGLLTLAESIGVIMGANIGTTITAWIVAYFGFKVKINVVAIILIGVFFPFLFSSRNNLKYLAEFIMGFGILFIGLDFLKGSVPDIKSNPEVLQFLSNITNWGYGSYILFALIGTVLTIVIQSSSATMAVTQVMLFEGWIPFPLAAAMVLGENIGTTITANLAAIVGNVHAKRAARFHLFFNLIGVTWVLAIFPFFLQGIDWLQLKMFAGEASAFADTPEARIHATGVLALFHSSFNILNVLLLFAFVPFLEKLVIKLQPSKGEDDEVYRLRYLSGGFVDTPELSLSNGRQVLELMAQVLDKMNNAFTALFVVKKGKIDKMIKKIHEREELTDNIEIELTSYLMKISESDISARVSNRINNMLRMANDMESVGDLYLEMTRNFQRLKEQNISLPEVSIEEITEMLDLCKQALKIVKVNLADDSVKINLKDVYDLDYQINLKQKECIKHNYKRLEKNIYPAKAGVILLDIINSAEVIGDYLVSINEYIAEIKK